MLPVRKNGTYEAEITDLNAEGEGIGRVEGFTVFVPGALPGERIRLLCLKVAKSYAIGKLQAVLRPSPDRVEPPCPYAPRCGGCAFMCLSYPAQLRRKRQMVADALARIGGLREVRVEPVLGMADPFRYRNKAQYPAGPEGLGFYARRSHRVIPVANCLIQHPLNDRVLAAVGEWMHAYRVPAYDETTGTGLLRHGMARVSFSRGEVLAVEQGELNRSIALRGSDEIALLARDVDRMRRALLGQIENERAAWEANRELITAMSHDIRTPLTSLLGYLDIIDHGNYRDAEQLRQYVSVSRDKALQLKELSDKLFQYFLLYGNRPMPLNWQTLGAAMLLEQLLGERALYLRSHGFYVEEDFGVGDCQIATDTAQLCRLFDNLFSNIEKYADPAAPVSIVCGVLTGRLRVRLGNAIRRLEDPVESTRVGLKTCEKIAQQLGGSLEYGAKGNYFSVAVIFPIVGAQRQGKDETN